MKETWRLHRDVTGWVCITDNPDTIRIMGSDTIPTAFTADADFAYVLNSLRKLNVNLKPEISIQDWPI